MTWGKERNKLGPCQDKREGTEVGIYGGVSGAVSGDDDGIGEAEGETGGFAFTPTSPKLSIDPIFPYRR